MQLNESLSELAAALKRLHDATDALNATISNFEETLLTLDPGIVVWCEDPLRVRESSESPGFAAVSHLGFAKIDDQWGLWLRRGACMKSGQEWVPTNPPNWKFIRLVDGSREERAAAIAKFPMLVDAMTQEAKERLAVLNSANKRAR